MQSYIEFLPNVLSESECKEYDSMVFYGDNTFSTTGDVLREIYSDGTIMTYTIYKGEYTLPYECRDCGDHFIIARYDRYDRIDKKTLEIIKDVSDC